MLSSSVSPYRLIAAALVMAAGTAIPAGAQEKRDIDWIDRRVEAWQPTKEERRFDDIAWVADLRTALKLGKEHHRPIFLFTHDGHMDVGRC